MFRNSHGLIVTFGGLFGFIGMLLYHYIISEEAGKQTLPLNMVDKIGSDEENTSGHLVIMAGLSLSTPVWLFIFILTPFFKNHKLR